MSSLPGGAADKLGNRYEHYWVALRIADLLDGTATRMRLEPAGADGVGIEFEIDIDGDAWGEQTKDHGTPWTINRLNAEDVLQSIKHQAGLGRRFRLITSSTATSLHTLSDRAKMERFVDFKKSLAAKVTDQFDDLVRHWDLPEEDAWRLLKGVCVEQHSFASLQRNTRLAFKLQYAGDPDVVIETLRGFCEEQMQQTLTAPQVAAYLESKGLRARRLTYDDNVRAHLHRTVERHQRRIERTSPSFGLLQRPETDQILASLLDADGPQVVIVDGAAGLGKSSLVAQVAAHLETDGWFVAGARMDLSTSTLTSSQLGARMDLDDSPAVLLGGVAGGAPALLVIDQLDAISVFSGRMPESFDAVDEVLAEARNLPNVRVLLVCRTVDLDNDQRLRSLTNDKARVVRHRLAKLDAADVRSHLADHGVHVPSDDTVELLRTPLHLAVYARLSDDARHHSYRTLQELYDQLTIEVRRGAEARAPQLDWAELTSTLVSYMSDNETLAAPRAILNSVPLVNVAALESEAVLVSDGTGIAFFHESYFDYLFASAFIADGRDLHDFLAASGQFLFRRAQTRQILEHLAATDRSTFRRVATGLLTAADIRSHLKHVVIGLLRQVSATPDDWASLDDIAWSDIPIAAHIRTLLTDSGWFDAADALGTWERWLADAARVDEAMNKLTFAARDRGRRVAELVGPHVGADTTWDRRLGALVGWSLTPDLIPFTVELIDGGHLDDARGPIAVNSDFWSMLYSVKEEDPAGTARLIGAYLRRGLARARLAGSEDPFESEHLSTHSQTDEVISEVAVQAPGEFVDALLAFVVDVAMTTRRDRADMLPAGHWAYRHLDADYGTDATVFSATADALTRLAPVDANAVRSAIAPLRAVECDELRFLVARALAALPDADDAVAWLLADVHNLALGWIDSAHWASREVIAAHSGACSDELYEQLETMILAYRSTHERAAVGRGQYTLLSAMDTARLSEVGRRRLGELGRRFADSPPSPPSAGAMAGWVGSPIELDSARRMSDDNWIAALRKHDHDKVDWRGRTPVGGASQLASGLGECAKGEPERFALLGLRFDHTIPAIALIQVIRNTQSAIGVELLTKLCEHAADVHGDDFEIGRAICGAITTAAAVTEPLVALIVRYAKSPDPEADTSQLSRQSTRDRLAMDGLNSTRGQAALAAGRAVATGSFIDQLLPTISALCNDPNLGVRTMATEAVLSLLSHDAETAYTLAEQLFDAPVEIVSSQYARRLLTYLILRAPERFAPQLKVALDGPPEIARQAGQVWAIAEYRGSLRPPVTVNIFELSSAARGGVAEVVANSVAETADQVSMLFDDSDADVRKVAARATRRLTEVPAEQLDTFIDRFVPSPAFDDHVEDLLYGLDALGSRLPPSTLLICDRAASIAAKDLGNMSTRGPLIGRHLIAIVLRLYRQGDAATRAGCLDIIDRLTDDNAYGIAEALAEER
jgi:hypothetical protein